MTICGYLGPKGTYSESAIKQFNHTNNVAYDCRPYSSFFNLFEALDQGECEKIFVPVENSIGGPVSSVLDLMVSYPSIYIEKECFFPISCHLFTKSIMDLEAITDIISHPQPISSCANFCMLSFHTYNSIKQAQQPMLRRNV